MIKSRRGYEDFLSWTAPNTEGASTKFVTPFHEAALKALQLGM